MLGKLLKYDLKWSYKLLGIFYVLSIIFSIVGRALGEIENSLIFDVISKISIGVAMAMIVNSLINCFIRLWVRMIRNMYKDESYLTHTLPVEKNKIFVSKVISGILAIFTTCVVVLLCLVICYYSEANVEVLKMGLELAADTYNTTVVSFVLVMALVIFIEFVYALILGYVGIIIGYKSNRNKLILSIIAAFVIHSIIMAITLGILLIYGLFNPEVMNLFKTTTEIDINTIKNILYIAIVEYGAWSGFLYWIGKKLLNKGVNVD